MCVTYLFPLGFPVDQINLINTCDCKLLQLATPFHPHKVAKGKHTVRKILLLTSSLYYGLLTFFTPICVCTRTNYLANITIKT